MEIQFLHERFTENDHKLLMGHIQRMASGEAPFFPATLSLVYDKLVEKALSKQTSGPDLGRSTGAQSVTTPTLPLQPPTPTSGVASSSTSSTCPSFGFQAAPIPGPPLSTTAKQTRLKCVRCWCITSVYDLYGGLHCPRCDEKGRNGRGVKGRPFMQCTGCSTLRYECGNVCLKSKCSGQFM